MNYIYGTDERDVINGTDEDDYIIAGAGHDFWVAGGAGRDVFEVNYGDEVVRIADFQVGIDCIALDNPNVLVDATFTQNGSNLDVRLLDNTLIRISNVTKEDVDGIFVFQADVVSPDEPQEPGDAPDGPIPVFEIPDGMNLITGTDDRDVINGTAADDYIIAGAGHDFWVAGGAGRDVFEVNYGDEVVRIADFQVGIDSIALDNPNVLADATFSQNGSNLDVRLLDNTLIRISNATKEDVDGIFVFQADVVSPDEPQEPGDAPDGPIPVFEIPDGMNLITGTDERDVINGTAADDYIIAGAGLDFWVTGGAGRDVFEANVGDEVVRIADFQVGIDRIALDNPDVLADATFTQNGSNLDMRLLDNTLIRISDLTEGELDDVFVFKSETAVVDETKKDLKIVLFGGQSLAFGATGRDWVNVNPQFENSLMMDFDNPQHGARGWETDNVDAGTFNGFTPRFEVAQETPATGAMNVLASHFPEKDFLSLHYGQSGKSLDFIAENTMSGLYQQLELLRDHADSLGYDIDPVIELVWIQGQSGSSGDYSTQLSEHRLSVEGQIKEILGDQFEVDLHTTITRGFGGKVTTREQFDAIQEDPNIYLGSTEVVFNSQYPAMGNVWNAHLTGEGYFMMGSQIGSHIFSKMLGNAVEPISVESVEEVNETTFHINFSGVKGELMEDTSVYDPEYFLGSPENYGIDIYGVNDGRVQGDIIASRIVDNDTIEIVYDRELSGQFRLWVGRSESDGWITEDSGAGYGGTTLFDSGQSFSAVSPDGGLDLENDFLYEFVPQQHFDFFA